MKRKGSFPPPHSLKESPEDRMEFKRTKFRVVGIGGGGCNIVSELARLVSRTDFIAANTDAQALRAVGRSPKKFPFGERATHGLGCGMDARLGFLAARQDEEKIKKVLEGQDLCVLVATLGGGSGSGAAPVFAELSQRVGNLTIGIFTLPFSFEGEKRKHIALRSLEKLENLVNTYVLIPNDSIFQVIQEDTPLQTALSAINRRLAETMEGFIETLFLPGLINIDFADVKTILQGRGKLGYIASAYGGGEQRAQTALDNLFKNHLYSYDMSGADRILFNITGPKDLRMNEVVHISKTLSAHNPKAKIIFGVSLSSRFPKQLRLTVLALGCRLKEGKRNGKRGGWLHEKEENSKTVSSSKGKQPASGASPLFKREKTSKPSPTKTERKQRRSIRKKMKRKRRKTAQLKIVFPPETQRRNAMEVKKAIDQEMEELQQREQQWDTPAFLRLKI